MGTEKALSPDSTDALRRTQAVEAFVSSRLTGSVGFPRGRAVSIPRVSTSSQVLQVPFSTSTSRFWNLIPQRDLREISRAEKEGGAIVLARYAPTQKLGVHARPRLFFGAAIHSSTCVHCKCASLSFNIVDFFWSWTSRTDLEETIITDYGTTTAVRPLQTQLSRLTNDLYPGGWKDVSTRTST